MSFIDDVAVLMKVSSFVFSVSTAAGVAVVVVVVGCVPVWESSCAASFVSVAAVVTAPGGGAVRAAILTL